MQRFDVIVLGAGAAGMMCAIEAGRRGRRVLVIDHARAAGEKIRISGGGRCNFTNLDTTAERFLSANPRYAISALSRYTPADFVSLVDRHDVAHHAKTQGQLFCDGSARQIVDLLVLEMAQHGVEVRLGAKSAPPVAAPDGGFELDLEGERVAAESVVVATGGKSIPKMGASGFGYDVAARFGLRLVETRPGLVPLTIEEGALATLRPLAGVSAPVVVRRGRTSFQDAILFTHRGLSGPAVLQISSYWREGEDLEIDLAPRFDALAALRRARAQAGRTAVGTVLAQALPRRLAQQVAERTTGVGASISDASDATLARVAEAVNAWRLKPVGSEGYRTAEVTVGGVDTRELDSRTMASRAHPGLYFVGEVVDVTGWLGGYNFQWAWASGWCAGQVA